MNMETLSKQDRDALLEFPTATLALAEDRLHTGVWTQDAFEAFKYLWELGPRISVRRLPYLKDLLPGARALVELHYEKAGPTPKSWRHLGMLRPGVGQKVDVRLTEGRERITAKYAVDRKGPFWDTGRGRMDPPAWEEDLWRPDN